MTKVWKAGKEIETWIEEFESEVKTQEAKKKAKVIENSEEEGHPT